MRISLLLLLNFKTRIKPLIQSVISSQSAQDHNGVCVICVLRRGLSSLPWGLCVDWADGQIAVCDPVSGSAYPHFLLLVLSGIQLVNGGCNCSLVLRRRSFKVE